MEIDCGVICDATLDSGVAGTVIPFLIRTLDISPWLLAQLGQKTGY